MSVTLRNKGGARLIEVAGGGELELGVEASISHAVGAGLSVSYAPEGGSVEVEAGAHPLVVKLLAEDGTIAGEPHEIPAGATVTFSGNHGLSINEADPPSDA